MGLSALYGPVSAGLMRREGTKRVYLGGVAIVALSYLLLGVSWTGFLGVLGIIVWWLGTTETGLCCSVVCGSSLTNESRATAMGSCESVALGIMSFIGPAIGAFIIGLLGGLKVSMLRPLFFMIFVGELGVFLFIKRFLGECGYIELRISGKNPRPTQWQHATGENFRFPSLLCVGTKVMALCGGLLPYLPPYGNGAAVYPALRQ
jgi:hypothetical protein